LGGGGKCFVISILKMNLKISSRILSKRLEVLLKQ
jgi:hypothetical protein